MSVSLFSLAAVFAASVVASMGLGGGTVLLLYLSFFSTLRAPSLNFNQKFAGLLSQNNLKNIRFKSNCIWEIKLL